MNELKFKFPKEDKRWMDYELLKKQIFDKIHNDCPKDFYFEDELIAEYRDIWGGYYRIFATKNKIKTILTRQYLGSNYFIATLTKLLT